MIPLLVSLGAGSLAAPILHRALKHRAAFAIAALLAANFLICLTMVPAVAAGNFPTSSLPWIPSLGVDLAFRIDGLALIFLLVILGVGTLIFIYAGSYLRGDPLLGRFLAILTLFATAMCGMVAADNLIVLFVFWELTSITSYLLIGHYSAKTESRASALQALLVTFLGGQALLAGFLLVAHVAGGFAIHPLGEIPIATSAFYPAILALVCFGAFTKSAQVPFHFWLPGAMAAPAPVSAFLHSATMVNAGIFLLARLSPALGGTDLWKNTLMTVGAATMLVGALLAFPQYDLKRLLAYSTVSALGTMVFLLGVDTTLAAKAAMVFFLVHALYKGALFLVAGTIDHEAGSRDVRELGGLARAMPWTAAAAGLSALSMCGLPPMMGFLSKELLYETKLSVPHIGAILATGAVFANILMVAVGLAVGFGPFHKRPGAITAHEGPTPLWIAPLTLAAVGIVLGLFPSLIDSSLIAPAVSAIRATPTEIQLKLWHGLNLVLALSAVTVTCGIGAFLLQPHIRNRMPGVLGAGPWTASALWQRGVDAILAFAAFQTRLLQNGSLHRYVIFLLATVSLAIAGPVLSNLAGLSFSTDWHTLTLYGGAILAAMIAGAIFAAISPSRLAAIVGLGIIGFGAAVIFALHGAPDLAITQLLVESLTLVILVLVVYRLPRIADSTPLRQRLGDAVIAILVGSILTLLTAKALHVDAPEPISSYHVENALTAHGHNIVNVTLVDFRALDTLGEITVLAAAALGVAALIANRNKRPGGGK